MEQVDELVDVGIHDGLSDQRQRAVLQRQRLLHALALHSLTPRELTQQSLFLALLLHTHALVRNHAFINLLGRIHLPAPCATRGIAVVAPAEETAVRTRQRGRRLHARGAAQTVEGVFVAGAVATQMRLRPTTEFHCAVGAHDRVALLRQRRSLLARDHFERLLRGTQVLDVGFLRPVVWR